MAITSVILALPTLSDQDERYYAMGTGSHRKRALYAASRVLITPDYHGHNSFNASELFGTSDGAGDLYRVLSERGPHSGSTRDPVGIRTYARCVTNVFREFWPDIATHVLHRHP